MSRNRLTENENHVLDRLTKYPYEMVSDPKFWVDPEFGRHARLICMNLKARGFITRKTGRPSAQTYRIWAAIERDIQRQLRERGREANALAAQWTELCKG